MSEVHYVEVIAFDVLWTVLREGCAQNLCRSFNFNPQFDRLTNFTQVKGKVIDAYLWDFLEIEKFIHQSRCLRIAHIEQK